MKFVGYAVVVLLAIAGMFAVNRCTDKGNAAEVARYKAQKHSDDSVVAVRDKELLEANARAAAAVPVYIAGKDRIIRVAAGTPAAEPVRACFELADKRISACEAARVAADSTISALRRDLKTTEAKPVAKEKRFLPFGEALYDFANTVPVIRAGATARIPFISAISLSVAGEYSAPPAGESKPAFRALAGVRVNF